MSETSDKLVSSALVDAVRKVKIAAAERTDVVVDMKEADRARLEILAQQLQPVFDDVPVQDERFDFAISSGLQPRLWIDATAHVMMGRDRRLYRFVRDTRMGRITLAEGNDPEPIAQAVTTYIAERLHERELAFAADEMVDYRRVEKPASETAETVASAQESIAEAKRDDQPATSLPASARVSKPVSKSQTNASAVSLWILGLFIGGGALLLVFRDAIIASFQ